MKREELTYLLQHPSTIDPVQTEKLREVLEQYPYFQAARAIRLKGLKNANSLHYNKELKVTAAYTADRSILFDFITSEEFNQNKIADQIKKQEQFERELPDPETEENKGIPKDPNLSLDQALKMKIRESEQIFDPELFTPYEEKKGSRDEDQEDTLRLGTPISFPRNENHSFTEWLKLTKVTPIDREDNSPEESTERSRKLELIDEFISKSPRITPSKSGKKINLAEENLITPEALMTETLARVYLEQKNYKKAIQAYKILILKNPEKSGFFADQIRAIEKLQENNS